MKTANRKRNHLVLPLLLLSLLLGLSGCSLQVPDASGTAVTAPESLTAEDGSPYSGEPYTPIDGNVPSFTQEELTTEAFESYSPLDSLGRCGAAYACLGRELMPREERGDISSVKPTGWHSVQYDFVDGKSLYNRCHLIGYQLTGENANAENLITGTRYMNVDGMLPFENLVADYIHETGGHVLYRVTPDFRGDELVARGVQMEALSVEDQGEAVSFNVYVYDVQPGVAIDYATGDSRLLEDNSAETGEENTYVLNTSSRKFHLPSCSGVSTMKAANRETFRGTREELLRQGYEPCGGCNP